MPVNHSEIAGFIWSIANHLRGPYHRHEYKKVILPLVVIRRFDCVLAPTKQKVVAEFTRLKTSATMNVAPMLYRAAGVPFYNISKMDFAKLLDDNKTVAANLTGYINGFSDNVRDIIVDRFKFGEHIQRMAERNLLFKVLQEFNKPHIVEHLRSLENHDMGTVFEHLIRIGNEQSNEEAGDHFTPREVIKLMVNLLFQSDRARLDEPGLRPTIYDPACGTGGMLSVAEDHLKGLNNQAQIIPFGQDYNDESYGVCKADMLMKSSVKVDYSEHIKSADTFGKDDVFAEQRFDYMLSNPPFGVEWKQQEETIRAEADNLGDKGRFGAGLPRINDGALLFLQHMISKMKKADQGGSRIAVVFNGSPLFTGDPGSPNECAIRRWIIEHDWLEGVIALPDQMFYNTGILTYIWILTNRKTAERKGKVQLLNAVDCFVDMEKSQGNKRKQIGDGERNRPNHLDIIGKLYGDGIRHPELSVTAPADTDSKQAVITSKVFPGTAFGYRKITIDRPLQRNWQASPERIARLPGENAFIKLATTKKKGEAGEAEIAAGQAQQQALLTALGTLDPAPVYRNRDAFLAVLKPALRRADLSPSASLMNAILGALGERDFTADVCRDAKGEIEADTDLRDTECVPLGEDIAAYLAREVAPHLPPVPHGRPAAQQVPGFWLREDIRDEQDGQVGLVGYEIPFTRHFYIYQPPPPLEVLERQILDLERDIQGMLAQAIARPQVPA
jgi:type I restriction enzyme M protein